MIGDNRFKMYNELLTQLLNDSVIADSIDKRCREIYEYYRNNQLDRALIEIIFLQGVLEGIFISSKMGID